MDAPWRIELLGRLRATQGDRVVTRFRARKTGVLLAYLAYYIQRPHPREVLIDLLWPEADLSPGRGNLSKELSSLRHQLEPPGVPAGALIVADRYSVQLNPAACVTDVAQFESALQTAARAGSAAERAHRLAEAVQLYSGELLPGCFDDWVLQERQHLAEAHLGALRQLVIALEQAGDPDGALEYARRAVRADPLSEETHYDLMRLYAAMGQPAATLRQYQELERLLRDEMGETPSAATRALVEELRRDARTVVPACRAPAEAVSPSTLAVPRLPLQFTRFFGREEEIVHLVELLGCPGTRLVTITGPGGSGKTRLAIAAADRLQEAFGAAIAFVPLADLTDVRHVADAILDSLGVPRIGARDSLEHVVEVLNRQPWLLLLDNFEHLVDEGAPLTRLLLERAPSLTCLVTSRQRLDMMGEHELFVPPLRTPGNRSTPEELMKCESVQLFVDRAQARQPDFQVTRTNAAAVAALCERLEGVPLALELAAARVHVLTPWQMLARLEQSFDVLVSRQRSVHRRHSSLRATLDWSFQLLDAPLQRLIARLSVFRGGWSLEAAEQVCEISQGLDELQRLRDCSLVLIEESAGEMRYRMLEPVRDYAREHLSPQEGASLQRRHAEYYLAFAERGDRGLRGRDQGEWLDRLEREHDNLRAALAWSQAAAERNETSLALAGALVTFWSRRGYWGEARGWLEAALVHADGARPTSARATALAAAANLDWRQGNYREARSKLTSSLAITQELGDRRGHAYSVLTFGTVLDAEGSYDAACANWEQCLPVFRELGDSWGVALCLDSMANAKSALGDEEAAQCLWRESVTLFRQLGDHEALTWQLDRLARQAMQQGDLAAARAHYEESLAIRRVLRDSPEIVRSLLRLGNMATSTGDQAAARAYYEESLAIERELGDRPDMLQSLLGLGMIALQNGHSREAGAMFQEMLSVARELPGQRDVALSLVEIAIAAAGLGQRARASHLVAAAMMLRESFGVPVTPHDGAEWDRSVKKVRAALGEEAFAAAEEMGPAMTLAAALRSA